jgi:bifunctional non-homologous end joining protein LigD
MSLSLYNKKRNFKATPEPSGKLSKPRSGLSFVIQRHKASHLHYDFRLEMEGVLKSWAVPKGPSLNPQDKRLAMMVEDHPYDYKDFAGIIPEGNYGAGIVEIWDEGEYTDLENSDKKTAEKKLLAGLRAGNLKIVLHGKKLKGEFALVKLKGKQDNSWLLLKHKDKYAVSEDYNSEEYTTKNSPINKWFAQNKPDRVPKASKNGTIKKTKEIKPKKKALKKKAEEKETPVKLKRVRALPGETRKLSHYIKPMLAKETDTPFSSKDWIYEIKWDGYRAIAEVNKKEVSLYSRNGNTFNASYPVVVEALKQLNIKAVLDGEIVVIGEEGKSNFQLLQYYGSFNEVPMEFRVFDLISMNGKDTTGLTLLQRKELLRELLPENDVVKYSDHIEEKGEAFFKAAKEKDLEGIMAKKADSLYYPGVRTNEWLKIKHHKTQEAIIAGFTEPTGGRKLFGALVLGIWKDKKLKYIGHTGSGFNDKGLKDMYKLLKPRIIKQSPFDEVVKTNRPATWVKPELVCEIKFTEWTKDGSLRHPIFLRLRNDKKASEVTLDATKPVKMKAKERNAVKEDKENEKTYLIGKVKVKTTNRNKIFWPEEKITKGDVVDYYNSISKYILPYLKGRPQSLKRNPNGITDAGFFQKDAGDEAPPWVKSKKIFSESTNKDVDYILCDNKQTLIYMANLGCIEINPWHSTIKNLDKPDYLIIDIDPSDNNTFEQVIEAANVVHEIFEKIGAPNYCKTSGASGLHIYVPTQRKYTYDQLKDFSHLICMAAQNHLPDFTSLERNLKKRGKDHIYLDYLQNRRGQTICAPYCLRPKEGATVSMPVKWKNVKPGLSPADYNIHNALKKIEEVDELWAHVLGRGINLVKCLSKLERL